MNIYTLDIIVTILLILIINDPLLRFFQSLLFGSFIASEIFVGIIIIILMVLIHKFILRRFFPKK